MMSTKTEHYQLNQYKPGNSFLRTDFNEDNAKIDAALGALNAEKAAVVIGSFLGDGTTNRFINLGFTPKAVLLMTATGQTYTSGNTYGGMFTQAIPLKSSGLSSFTAAVITTGGMTLSYWYQNKSYVNAANYTYLYLAIR